MIKGLSDSDKKIEKENSQVTHHPKADGSSEFPRLVGDAGWAASTLALANVPQA